MIEEDVEKFMNAAVRLKHIEEQGIKILSRGSTWAEFHDKLRQDGEKPTLDEVKAVWDRMLTDDRVFKRGVSYFFRRFGDPEMKVGTKIWRHVVFNIYTAARIQPLPDAKTVRALPEGDKWVVAGASAMGLVCFVEGDVPETWIALEVTRFTQSGKAAFVKAVIGTESELLDAYKRPCVQCKAPKLPTDHSCLGCLRIEEEAHARRQQEVRGYVPAPKAETFVCRACNPKAKRGSGKCLICKKDYA